MTQGPIALGRRLFPTLPEDRFDKGPLVGGAGRWTLVADVRLDARDELRSELGLTSGEVKELSDAALVMRAIERWQQHAITKLIGDFALILWDSQEERLVLARDFLGNRPLHFCEATSFLAVASMPKGLHVLPELPRDPDEQSVARFLAMLPEHGRRSFYKRVRRVLPGEIVDFSPAGRSARQYLGPEVRTASPA